MQQGEEEITLISPNTHGDEEEVDLEAGHREAVEDVLDEELLEYLQDLDNQQQEAAAGNDNNNNQEGGDVVRGAAGGANNNENEWAEFMDPRVRRRNALKSWRYASNTPSFYHNFIPIVPLACV